MQTKNNALIPILGLISMVFVGYALFITVFNQIVSQNEGFFYAIVFGGILILLYIFINIICKLLAVSDNMRYKSTFKVLYIFLVIGACAAFFYLRLRYRSVLEASETTFYQSAILINNNAISVSKNLITDLLNNPAEYVLALIYSLIIKIIPDIDNSIVIVNLIFCCLTTIFVYLISSRFTDNFCAVIAALISLFAPGQMFCAYSYNPDCMYATLFFADILVLVELILSEKNAATIIYSILYALLSAVLLFSEPTIVILLFLTIILVPYTRPEKIKHVIISTFVSVLLFGGLLLFKSYNLQLPLSEVVSSAMYNMTFAGTGDKKLEFSEMKAAFDSYVCADDRNIENNYSYLVNSQNVSIQALTAAWIILGNQMIFMFVLVLCLSGIFTSLQYKDKRYACLFIMIISASITMFISYDRDVNTYYYHSILSILSSCGLFYIYLNHHREEADAFRNKMNNISVEEKTDGLPTLSDEEIKRKKDEFMLRACALIYVNYNNDLYNMIKDEERISTSINRESLQNEVNNNENDTSIEDAVFEELTPVTVDFTKQSTNMEIIDSSVIHEEIIDNSSEYQDVESQPSANEVAVPAITYLPNPLPVPVRKPHSGLDYEYDVDDDNYDWDFDIKDEELADYDY